MANSSPCTNAGPLGDRRLILWIKFIELSLPRHDLRRRAGPDFFLIEHRVGSHVRWHGGQHLLLAVDQPAGVKAGNLEPVPMRDGIRGASLHAISTKDTSIVVYVIDLSVTLRAAYPMLRRILRRLDINAVRRTRRRAQEAGHTLLQAILVPLEHVHAAITLLEFCPLQRPRP